MYLEVSSTCHASKEERNAVAEKADHDSSAHLSPAEVANDPSELKLMSSRKETSRPSKTVLRAKNYSSQFHLGKSMILFGIFYDRIMKMNVYLAQKQQLLLQEFYNST